ncbi:MAG TPA: LacI family DNA-binding transcriptional regulator [Capsulimonadaceae bacterium]|jgi:LacI family transcriptional regulator
MTITMKDIARRAGVSRQAVSAALGSSKTSIRVSDETKWRVEQVASELGYRPNSAARTMVTGKFGCVAMLLTPTADLSTISWPFLWGIHDALEARNLHLLQAMLPKHDPKRIDSMPKFLREWMIDGVLVNYMAAIPPALEAALDNPSQPAVWMNVNREFDAVRPNDYEASRELTQRLIGHGHTRITFAMHGTTHYSKHDRIAGYTDAMRAAGLQPSVAEKLVGTRGWVEVGREWFSSIERPTGVIAYDQFTASPLLFAAKMEGLDVPGDLTLATFRGESREDDAAGVIISSMLVPWYQMGSASVGMLVDKIDHPEAQYPVRLIPFTFDPGETVGPPR